MKLIKLDGINNIFQIKGYKLKLDELYDETHRHQKLADTSIYHKEMSIEILFPKKDVFICIYYIFLVLYFHFSGEECRIYLNSEKIYWNKEDHNIGIENFLKNCSNLQLKNTIKLEFDEASSYEDFRLSLPFMVTPYKDDSFYMEKELENALKEGRRLGKMSGGRIV